MSQPRGGREEEGEGTGRRPAEAPGWAWGARGGERGQARGGGPRGGPGYRTRRPASPAGSCSLRASAQSRSWDLRKGRGDVAPKHALSASFFLPCFLVSRAPSVFLRLSPPPPPLSPPLLAPFRFLPPPLPTAPPASPLRPPPPPPRLSCLFFFFFAGGPGRGGPPPGAPARAAPSPGCRAAACRNLQSGAGGAGPVSMETASPGAGRSGADRAQSMDQCKPPLRSRPNSTGAPARPLVPCGELAGEPRVRPPRSHVRRAERRRSARAPRRGDKEGARCRESLEGLHLGTEMGWDSGPRNVLRTFSPKVTPTLWTQSSYSDESWLKLPGSKGRLCGR